MAKACMGSVSGLDQFGYRFRFRASEEHQVATVPGLPTSIEPVEEACGFHRPGENRCECGLSGQVGAYVPPHPHVDPMDSQNTWSSDS